MLSKRKIKESCLKTSSWPNKPKWPTSKSSWSTWIHKNPPSLSYPKYLSPPSSCSNGLCWVLSSLAYQILQLSPIALLSLIGWIWQRPNVSQLPKSLSRHLDGVWVVFSFKSSHGYGNWRRKRVKKTKRKCVLDCWMTITNSQMDF